MLTRKLKLNPDETEFIIFGLKTQRDKFKPCFPIDILGSSLPCRLSQEFGCVVRLRDFRQVRWFLTHDASIIMANALVSSRLDYCNSLFRSLSKFNLLKLQCSQNSAARIVSNTSRYTSITPVFKKLHWLPIEQCIVFKTAIFPGTASSGKAGSCLPLVGSLQYRTLTNCMYWFPLPFQLPVVI